MASVAESTASSTSEKQTLPDAAIHRQRQSTGILIAHVYQMDCKLFMFSPAFEKRNNFCFFFTYGQMYLQGPLFNIMLKWNL